MFGVKRYGPHLGFMDKQYLPHIILKSFVFDEALPLYKSRSKSCQQVLAAWLQCTHASSSWCRVVASSS